MMALDGNIVEHRFLKGNLSQAASYSLPRGGADQFLVTDEAGKSYWKDLPEFLKEDGDDYALESMAIAGVIRPLATSSEKFFVTNDNKIYII